MPFSSTRADSRNLVTGKTCAPSGCNGGTIRVDGMADSPSLERSPSLGPLLNGA